MCNFLSKCLSVVKTVPLLWRHLLLSSLKTLLWHGSGWDPKSSDRSAIQCVQSFYWDFCRCWGPGARRCLSGVWINGQPWSLTGAVPFHSPRRQGGCPLESSAATTSPSQNLLSSLQSPCCERPRCSLSLRILSGPIG